MVMSARSENQENADFFDSQSDIENILVQNGAEWFYGAFTEQMAPQNPQNPSSDFFRGFLDISIGNQFILGDIPESRASGTDD